MNLYLYKTGTSIPVLTIENAVSYTDNRAVTEDGSVYGPFAEDVELSSLEDCSEALRAKWRREHCLADYPELMTFEERRAARLAELSAACNAAITAGCDVTLSAGSGHISLTAEDQINLSTALAAVETAHKLYQTTYYNHLATWVRRCETVDELEAVTYGAALPEDLAANMAAVLAAAGGTADV